ncbi:hypothetical protein Q7P35_006927 [Cladosporium inversicolor]
MFDQWSREIWEEELKSQEVSIRVSRLAEEPGEFWSSGAASLKPSVRVTISVGGLGQAQNDAGGGSTRMVAGGGGDSGSSSGGGGVAAARGSRLRYGAQRASRGKADGGRHRQFEWQQWRQQQLADAGPAGFVPQGEAKGYDNNDDKSESDETLSLSSHHKDTAAHHGETAQGAHDSPTRVAARLHPIIARPHDDGGGSPRIPRSAALRSSFTRNTRICYL